MKTKNFYDRYMGGELLESNWVNPSDFESNFESDFSQGDVIFLSGNTTPTATIDTITNATSVTLTSVTSGFDANTANQVIQFDSKFSAGLDPGKAYVRGYEIETVVPTYLDLPKPRTTDNFDAAITNIEVGNLTRVTKVFGTPDLAPFISGEVAEPYRAIELHSVKNASRGATPNQLIGVARARAFEHASGLDANSDNKLSHGGSGGQVAQFNLYLFDIRMFTQIQLSANFGGSPTGVAQGSKITGQTSGATGFVHSAVTVSYTHLTLPTKRIV